MKKHKELIVWQKLADLVVVIYKLCSKFHNNEKYGIVSQMRRAAVSIPSNIAEGVARNPIKEYIRSLYNTLGFFVRTRNVNTSLKSFELYE